MKLWYSLLWCQLRSDSYHNFGLKVMLLLSVPSVGVKIVSCPHFPTNSIKIAYLPLKRVTINLTCGFHHLDWVLWPNGCVVGLQSFQNSGVSQIKLLARFWKLSSQLWLNMMFFYRFFNTPGLWNLYRLIQGIFNINSADSVNYI